jgi:hypothetical protein
MKSETNVQGKEEEIRMTGRAALWDGQCGTEGIDSHYRDKRDHLVKIKNETETAVRSEVERLCGRGRQGTGTSRLPLLAAGFHWLTGSKAAEINVCQCPHCSADVLALALSNLPAGYCLSHHYAVGRKRVDVDEVKRQVQTSLRRVGTRPRHAAGEPLPGSGEVRLVDFGMREGAHMVRPLLQRIANACSCSRCRADALAYGLNRSRARYGVEVRGKIRMPPHELDFVRHDLLAALDAAAHAVAENPRHDSPGKAERPGESA